jgi:hypothetical protein
MLIYRGDPEDLRCLLYRLQLQALRGSHGRNAQRSRRPRSEGDERSRRTAASAKPGRIGEGTTGLPLDFRRIAECMVGTAGEESKRRGVKG